MNLKARLLNLDHMLYENVDPNGTRVFRNNMIEELMKTTDIGTRFFNKCGIANVVLKQIEMREVERKKILEIMKQRNRISKIKDQMEQVPNELEDGTANPYIADLEVQLRELQEILQQDIDTYELSFERSRAIRNSKI